MMRLLAMEAARSEACTWIAELSSTSHPSRKQSTFMHRCVHKHGKLTCNTVQRGLHLFRKAEMHRDIQIAHVPAPVPVRRSGMFKLSTSNTFTTPAHTKKRHNDAASHCRQRDAGQILTTNHP